MDSAMHGLRWIGTARVFAQLVTWGLTAFTVRLLEPRDYGIVATSGLFTVLAGLLLDGGLGVVLITSRETSARVEGAAVTAVFLLSVVLASLIVAIAPIGGAFFHSAAVVNVLRISALQLPLTALTVVPAALLAKQMKFREMALAQSLASVIQGIATLAMAYAGAAYWSLIWGTLLGISIRAAAMWVSLNNKPLPNFDIKVLRPYWQSGSQMVGQRVVWFVTADFDTFLLGRLGGPVVLGAYSLAKTLSHSMLDQLSGIVTQVSMPAFAAKADNVDAQIGGLVLVISAASALVFPLFWLLGVISQVAFPLVFGARWASLVVPFMAFTCILPLRSVYALLDSAILGTGRVSTTFKNMLTWSAIMIPLMLIVGYFSVRIGGSALANAIALSWVAGFPVVFWFATRRIASSFNTDVRGLLRPILPPALCAGGSCILVEIAHLELSRYMHPIAQLVVEMMLGGASYWLLMRHYARAQYDVVFGLTRRLLRR
jgi:O-antigen/teichoic acid export membrane protein